MKCDELKPLLYSIRDLAYVDEPQPEPNFQNPHDHAVYKATEVDEAIDELKTEHHKERDEYISMVHQKDEEIAELKATLEDVKATAYADIVDAGMENRRLKRALWLTRGAVHKAKRKAMYGLLQAYPLWDGTPAGLEVHKNIHRYDGYERKCRAKAEEYK